MESVGLCYDGIRLTKENYWKETDSCDKKRGRIHLKKRDRRFAIAGGGLLAAALLLQVLARCAEGFATWYAHNVYPLIVGIVGRISGIVDLSVAEICIYLLFFCLVVYLIRNFRKPARTGCRIIFLTGLLLFLYTANCGVNYYAMAFSEYAGISVEKSTEEELKALCRFLVEQVNEAAREMEAADEAAGSYRENRVQWREEGVRAMQKAGERFPSLQGFYPKPKEVAVDWILSVQQLCGIYSPFTVEANFNGHMPDYNVPHTICHELSHLKGFMREDEANFIGYLACIFSDEPAFRYSGYLTGWVYAGSQLARADMETYIQLNNQLCTQAQNDLQKNAIYWNRYEGKVAEAASQWNDTYLKINNQTDGVRSYGRMVDLMLAYRNMEQEKGVLECVVKLED